MASPRPPPPLPVIKEKTRALQQKIRRRAAPNTASQSLTDQHSSPFPVIHSAELVSTSTVAITPSAPTSPALISADTAIARLRTYRDEQLLWHSAVEHCDRRTLRTAIQYWRHAARAQSHRNLLSPANQLSQQHSERRLRAAVHRWAIAAQASRRHNEQHRHLTRFYAKYVQRVCFIGWVAHTLHRKDKEVGALLAHSLYRSNTVRAGWRLWRETAEIATQQRVLQQRADRHAQAQLTEHALAIWRAQGSLAVKEREKERSAALHGDTHSKRYYLQQWRRLAAILREEEEAAPALAQRLNQQLVSEAWQAWREESEWRHAAQLASDRLVRWRQQWTVRAAWEEWEGRVKNEKKDEKRAQQADEWHDRQQMRGAVRQWSAANRESKIQQLQDKRQWLGLRQSLHHWRTWARQQRLTQRAKQYYEHNTARQTLHWWGQQLQLSGDDRLVRERARTHEYESRMLSALKHWKRNINHERQSRERMEAATAYQRNRLLQKGFSALSAHRHQRHTERQQASLIRRQQLQSAVVLLYQHALYQRHCWQLHLRAKRFRYFHLLRQAWRGWHEARQQEAAAEERLYTERCGGLVRDWTRQLFGAWLRLTSEQRLTREREVVALMHWRGRLVVEAWQEWQIAVLDRLDEQQRFRTAADCHESNAQRHALKSWLSYTRFKQQVREAEGEAIAVGRQQLQLLAQRRAWQHFQLAFHTSRALRFELNRADKYHHNRHLHHCLHAWHHHSSASARRNRLHAAADIAHGRLLLLLAWRHWQAIQTERRRLLTLHVRAMDWRKVREERRIWQAWKRWVLSKRAKRQQEADMRRLRVERLQVEGVRQWVMVGLEWIQQKKEMEIEARQLQHKREQKQYLQQQAQGMAVAKWVRRIAEHWRHRTAKKEEAVQPLITQAQLTRWREVEKQKKKPKQLERPDKAARDDNCQMHSHDDTLGAVAPTVAGWQQSPVPSDTPWAPSAVEQRPSVTSRRTRVRTEPRRHVELLLDDSIAPLLTVPAMLDVSQLSSTIPPDPHHQHQPIEMTHSPQPPTRTQPPALFELSGPAVDDALLAALSAPATPQLDLSAIESRLHFLASLRSAYINNRQELEKLQAATSDTSSSTSTAQRVHQLSAVHDSSHHARCAVLLHACLDFEQQRHEWKREVQQWQSTLQRAQMSSG